MANIRSIKRRIKTAKNIAQTTRAMQLVAASRMKKAQILALQNKPYSENLIKIVRNLIGKVNIDSGEKTGVFFKENAMGKTAIVLITSDKGLAGPFISNFGRFLVKFIKEEQKNISDYEFLVFGKKGKDLVLKLGGNIVAQFEMGMTQPKFEKVPPVVKLFEENYLQKKYQRVILIFTDFINTLTQMPGVIQLLPLKKHGLEEGQDVEVTDKEYLFEPTASAVLNDLVPHYLEQEIYHAFLESYASEQSARMTAMKNATDNAEDIISELTLFYNKARQQAITAEISDITTATLAVS